MNWLVKRILFILVMCIGGITLANWLYGPVSNGFAFVYGMLVGIAGAILFPKEEEADE
jgi:hypothetical protein